VTNAHVVGNADKFIVTTSRGKRLTGSLVGAFPEGDLAVIKADAASLTPASFADSTKLRVGDLAIAIGNPLGLASSVTEGIISGLHRLEPEGNGIVLPNLIQTSAPINPGNSGGALVDLRGRLIGIPTLAAADPQLGGAAAGIGFAIPSNIASSIATQLIQHGSVTNSNRAYLGVEVADTGGASGVYITRVIPGTAADKAGLQAGELITAANGTPTPTSNVLAILLARLKPGQKVTVKFIRQDRHRGEAKVVLGEYSSGRG